MARYLKLYAVTLAAFLVVDLIWLVVVARRFYEDQIGFLMAPQTNWVPAVVFYLLFVAGVLVFVVLPGLASRSLGRTLARAALFGLVTYATYDLTNLATIEDWPLTVTIVDLVWGTFVSVVVSLAGVLAGRWLDGRGGAGR